MKSGKGLVILPIAPPTMLGLIICKQAEYKAVGDHYDSLRTEMNP